MWEPLRVAPDAWRHRAMIGVGGIGTGAFFALAGNHTLGREESRAGHFLDRRDYCKLHIIGHYVQTVLGGGFSTFPIGQVGDDPHGSHLVEEMKAAGLDTRYVRAAAGRPTLFSFCFLYPDGSGGNLTTGDSASSGVDEALVASAEAVLGEHAGNAVALAVPEVPLAARRALLELGTAHHCHRVAAFTTGEVAEAAALGLLGRVDLLALNRDEAAVLAGTTADDPPDRIAAAAVGRALDLQPSMHVSVTAGRLGSWVWDGGVLSHLEPVPVQVAGSAGAGDAHLAGLIAGTAAGLSLADAHHLAVLMAGLSVTSPHTICPDLDRRSLGALAHRYGRGLPAAVEALLEEPA
jgi:ribokinase